MNWGEVVLAVLQLILFVAQTWKEKNDARKKIRTEWLQSGLRGIIDHDKSRVGRAFDALYRNERVFRP